MKKERVFVLALILVFLGATHSLPAHAQQSAKTVTLLYSNNISGEIEPCPT